MLRITATLFGLVVLSSVANAQEFRDNKDLIQKCRELDLQYMKNPTGTLRKKFQILGAAIKANPQDWTAYRLRGLTYYHQILLQVGDRDQALQKLSADLAIVLKHTPSHPWVHVLHANQLDANGNLEECATALQKAYGLLPETTQPDRYNKARIACQVADKHMRLSKFDKAVTWLDKAIALDNKNADTYATKANCLLQLRKYGEAMDACEKAKSLSNDQGLLEYIEEIVAQLPVI